MRWYCKACCWFLVVAFSFSAWVAWRSHRYPTITEELAGRVSVGMALAEVDSILGPARDETRGADSTLEYFPPNGSLPSRYWVSNELVIAVCFDPYTTQVASVEHWKPDAPASSAPQQLWNAIVRSFGEDRTEPLIPRAEPIRIHTTITGGIVSGKRKRQQSDAKGAADLHPSADEDPRMWEKAGFRPGMMGDAYPFHFLDADEPRARPGLLSFQAYRWPPDFSKLPLPPQPIGLDLSMFRDADGEPKGEITDKHLKELLKLENIERLSICGAKVTAEGWKHVSDMRKLRALSLIGGKLDAAALTHLGSMRNLEKLFAIEVETDERELGRLKNLRRLDLHGTENLTASGVMKLAAIPRLADLAVKIDQSKIEPGVLAQLKYLTKLDLSFSRFIENGLNEISELRGLRSLNLSSTKGDDANIRALAKMTNLEELNLSGTRTSDEDLKQLQSLKRIRRVDLRGTQITDKGLEHLRSFPNLVDVELSLPEFGQKAIDDFKKACPKIRIVERDQGGAGV